MSLLSFPVTSPYPAGTRMLQGPHGDWLPVNGSSGRPIEEFVLIPNPNGQGGHLLPRDQVPGDWRPGMGLCRVNDGYKAVAYADSAVFPYLDFDYGAGARIESAFRARPLQQPAVHDSRAARDDSGHTASAVLGLITDAVQAGVSLTEPAASAMSAVMADEACVATASAQALQGGKESQRWLAPSTDSTPAAAPNERPTLSWALSLAQIFDLSTPLPVIGLQGRPTTDAS